MQAFLQRVSRFLAEPLGLTARFMLLAAAALLVATYFFPLWNLTMFAPQYPDGLRLDIYSYTLIGGNGGQDVKEINVLNHYIGMQDLVNESFTEFKWMPFVIGALGLLILRAMVHGTVVSLVDVTMLFVYFGAFSMGTFAYRLWSYGQHLDPHAPMRIKPFMPVVIGSQQIANFVQTSLPMAGTVCMGLFLAAIGAAIWLSRKEEL